jgi:hypothetical protein
MSILVILTIALQIACGVHAVRHGQFVWVFVILFFPLLGCAIYGIVVLWPQLNRAGAKAASGVTRAVDPDRDYRARLREAEMVGSADSKKALAEECIKRSDFPQAVALFESAAIGLHADDPALLHGLARARFLNSDPAGAQKALDDLRAANPDWSSPDAHLLYARALEAQGKLSEAFADYEALIGYFPGEEARCRLALLLQKEGRADEARQLFQTVVQSVDGAPKHYRRAQNEWLQLARRNLGA